MGFQEATHTLERQSLGYSYVRMVPKAGGMRCLVNMSRQPAEAKAKGYRASINQKLQNLFHVLTFEKTRNPSRVGASVLGLDDVYAKLRWVRACVTRTSQRSLATKFPC
jgi:telomerase reverse transcriptase